MNYETNDEKSYVKPVREINEEEYLTAAITIKFNK